jgi:hypothetical protein
MTITETKDRKSVITLEKKELPPVEIAAAQETLYRALFFYTLFGAIFGCLTLGAAAYMISARHVHVASLDMLSASGPMPATLMGAGFGIALGGLGGAILAWFRSR